MKSFLRKLFESSDIQERISDKKILISVLKLLSNVTKENISTLDLVKSLAEEVSNLGKSVEGISRSMLELTETLQKHKKAIEYIMTNYEIILNALRSASNIDTSLPDLNKSKTPKSN